MSSLSSRLFNTTALCFGLLVGVGGGVLFSTPAAAQSTSPSMAPSIQGQIEPALPGVRLPTSQGSPAFAPSSEPQPWVGVSDGDGSGALTMEEPDAMPAIGLPYDGPGEQSAPVITLPVDPDDWDDETMALEPYEGEDWISSPFAVGRWDAPITVIKYASMTCGHCGAFHNETLPLFQDDIASGRIRFEHRNFPLDQFALVASVVTHCAGEFVQDGYHTTKDRIYATQGEWMRSENPVLALFAIGQQVGLDEEELASCLNDEWMVEEIMAEARDGAETHGVRATPSFLINGTLYEGNLPMDSFRQIFNEIDPR